MANEPAENVKASIHQSAVVVLAVVLAVGVSLAVCVGTTLLVTLLVEVLRNPAAGVL